MSSLTEEISKRRTFAIISHPDAGKTTVSEKLLLFGGAIQQAGAIKAKKTTKFTTSDWMELEKQRGVSVSTSVMCFSYEEAIINLLDTPGHADFSEDTYRTLSAVDSVLMIIDSTKGVESRTQKLMDVCRQRDIPVITFMNKLDREGKDPFDLLEDVEKTLSIQCAPYTWPISMGKTFKGVYNLRDQSFNHFEPSKQHFQTVENATPKSLSSIIGDDYATKLGEDLEMIQGVLEPLDKDAFLNGIQTPVFFGSAINNFGMVDLLHALVELAPAPLSRPAVSRTVAPDEENTTGFVFKIHANMDPKHRDRIAFMRICSGRFQRGMKLKNTRLNREIKIANPLTFMAQTRSLAETAYPGDIIGLHDTGLIKIGDTFSEKEPLQYTGIPSFAPELFRRVVVRNALKTKQLNKGLQQLIEEGAVQLFRPLLDPHLILGAVGELQFDVVKFRLQNEYSADCDYKVYEAAFAYWLHGDANDLQVFIDENKAKCAHDPDDKIVTFFRGIWEFQHIRELYPDVRFYRTSECKEKDLVL